LIDAGWQGKTDLTALCGGEALPRDLARELSSRVRALFNMYGPTETTIWSTVHHVTDCDRDIPIGHPIANTSVYVLGTSGRPAPIGVPGELCIGGEGVARGYRHRPELTTEKFVVLELPGEPPERVYRTGDVVRLRADLALEFVGRRDHQVKLRGYRIELGEIESVLAEHLRYAAAWSSCAKMLPATSVWWRYRPCGGRRAADRRASRRAPRPAAGVHGALGDRSARTLPLTPNDKIDRVKRPGSAGQLLGGGDGRHRGRTSSGGRRNLVFGAPQERVGLHENFFDPAATVAVIKVTRCCGASSRSTSR
jgi:hypothetical protein